MSTEPIDINKAKEMIKNIHSTTDNDVWLAVLKRLEMEHELAKTASELWHEPPPTTSSFYDSLEKRLSNYRQKHKDFLKAIKEYRKVQ